MHIRKVAAALLLAASPWLAAASPAPNPAPIWPMLWQPFSISGTNRRGVTMMLPGVIECLHSTQAAAGTRWRIKWKGFCEDMEGACLRAQFTRHANIISNWQAWKPDGYDGWWKSDEDDDWWQFDEDEGWWRADFTLLGVYKHARVKVERAIAELNGTKANCP